MTYTPYDLARPLPRGYGPASRSSIHLPILLAVFQRDRRGQDELKETVFSHLLIASEAILHGSPILRHEQVVLDRRLVYLDLR